ncbi:MAG: PrgI family protein [Candidatus Sungbacteria bacterium]|nr:PrgI family protein [Candidatus Sungbacteria bacterium]
MKQYQVPQFITIEDKVIGPLTLKQFGFLAAGGVLIFILHSLLVPLLFYPVAGLIGGFAAALAFLKVQQQPFPTLIRRAFLFFIRPRLYLWKKEKTPPAAISDPTKKEVTISAIPKMSASKLSDLAWSLDIQGRMRENTNNETRIT